MRGLSAPDMRSTVVTNNGYNNDIITAINSRFPVAYKQAGNVLFSGRNLTEKGRAIYNYLRSAVKYQKDEPGKQVIQMPSRMLMDTKQGDCKSLALAAAAFMKGNGFKNVSLRYASYLANDPTPTHVYAVGYDTDGSLIIIDPVYHQFNKEVKYQYKKDYPMQISVLSGVPSDVRQAPKKKIALDPLDMAIRYINSGKISPGGLMANILNNYIQRKQGTGNFFKYSQSQIRTYQDMLKARYPKITDPFLAALTKNEIDLIQNGSFTGNILINYSSGVAGIRSEVGKISLKKIGKKIKKVAKNISPKAIFKGVKAVGLSVPRKAFLAMVALNTRGLAKRLSKLNDGDLKKVWVDKFAGELSVLKKAINNGKNKKPLFGQSARMKSIKGVGFIVTEDPNAIGTVPVATALVAAASPIVVAFIRMLKSKGVPAVPEAAEHSGESGDFMEAESMSQDAKPGILDYAKQAFDIVKSTGIIPDRPLTEQEAQIDKAIPGDDLSESSSFAISPVVLIGAAAAAYFLFIRKK
jgi:hypothetical protein